MRRIATRRHAIPFLVLLTVVSPATAHADSPKAVAEPQSWSGTVLDPSGAAIPGASVEVIDLAGNRQVAITDADGAFHLVVTGPGPYTVVATARGFAARVLTIDNATRPMAIAVAPARVEEQVTVTSSLPGAIVSSGTKLATRLLDVPQTIDVVSQTLLRSQAATSMQDALRNVAGVSPSLGEGRRDQFLIRGFSALNDTLVDGVRDDALYYRDLATVDRIEVLKGPAAALFGRGSSGGVINRILKSPSAGGDIDDYALSVGSLGARRATADIGRHLSSGRLAFRLVAAGEDSSSFRDHSSLERTTVAPSVLWTATPATTVLAQIEYLHDRRVPDRGIPSVAGRPADVRIEQYYGYPDDDFIRSNVAGASVRVEHRFAPGWLVRNVFRAAIHDTDFSNTAPSGVKTVAGTLKVTRQQYNVAMTQTNVFNQSEIVASARFAGLTHALLAGVEVGSQSRDQMRFNGTAPEVALVNPVLTRPIYSVVPTSNNLFHGETAAAYAQDLLTFSSRWKALVGARGDQYRQTLDDRNPANVDLARIDRNWSPRAGVVFEPSASTSLYASISRSFQPSGEGLSLAVNAADLKPEISRNLETGMKANLFGGRATGTAAVFRLDRRNIKTTDPLDPTRLVLVGRQRTDGVELAFDGRVTKRLDAHAAYAWLDAAVLKSNTVTSGVPIEGNRPGLVPVHSMNVWSSYAIAERWSLGGGVTVSGDRFTSNDDLVTLLAYARADAMVRYTQGIMEVALNARNLFNARYYETSTGNFQIFPGAPRELLMTVRFRR